MLRYVMYLRLAKAHVGRIQYCAAAEGMEVESQRCKKSVLYKSDQIAMTMVYGVKKFCIMQS
jgi:hypothetical protein